MVELAGPGAQVQFDTEASRQVTHQDSSSVHVINPAQENLQPVNAVQAMKDVAPEVSEEAAESSVNVEI